MSITTRLILLLMVLVVAIMVPMGYYRLSQREIILENALHSELRAHSVTMQLALEAYYRSGQTRETQQLINNLADNSRVYAVALFDGSGKLTMVSNPLVSEQVTVPVEVQRVIASGEPIELSRKFGKENVFSSIRPINISPGIRGAVEVAQPQSFIIADFARARRQIWLDTVVLCLVIFLGVWILLRRNLARPIKDLMSGAGAVSRGDLSYRVTVPHGSNELARLADGFNQMAEHLVEQRSASERASRDQLKLEQQLLTAERLAALGRLAAGVAHEMGAPLNVIKGRIEMLRGHSSLPLEKVDRNLEIIDRQANAITHTIQQLLNLARPRKLSLQLVHLDELIDNTLELIESDAADAGVQTKRLRTSGVEIEVDQEWLKQVLLNLYRNALHAMPNGGHLTVEVLDLPVVRGSDQFLGIQVSDTGTGIAQEHLNRIFDPFFTTKDVGQGTGLGLSLSRRIVEEHGGWIQAVNRPEGGAAFSLFLPKGVPPPEGAREYVMNEELA